MTASDILRRIESRDPTLWPEGNVSQDRLGWLDVPGRLAAEAADLAAWAATIDQGHVILLGMGGSSLGPAVLAAVAAEGAAGPHAARRRVTVCDTTDPQTVAGLDFDDAFVVVSSKSGTTLEPNALLAHAWSQVADPRRYAVITDPGTPLAALGDERGFHRTFLNPADIGGRYSVLSFFGMVPAALCGYDVAELCEAASAIDRTEAVELGLAMGAAALAGRDKVTIVVPEAFRSFGLWIEQLIAESTGKQGRGCVPVPTTEAESGPDRHVVTVSPGSAAELAAQFLRWELATAAAGHVLDVDPFDEPNVAESKHNTAAVLDALPLPAIETVPVSALTPWLDATVRPGDYVSIQAYVPFGVDRALAHLRTAVRDRLGGLAVTAGYGPRFLHSTGQLHKGGPASVVAVQLLAPADPPADVPIPGSAYSFGTLIGAQAVGDRQSLEAHGRRVLSVAWEGAAWQEALDGLATRANGQAPSGPGAS